MSSTSEQVQIDSIEEDILARVAAIDVGKDSGMVCTRVPHPSKAGRRASTVWSVPARTRAILDLGDRLVGEGIERVVLEATSDYWRPFYYLLEARGLLVWLVNARDVKNVPGRPKTDKLDAIWLAKLNERGMLRPSFVPPVEIRQLRDYTRLRVDLTGDRSRHIQRLEKLLEDALIKLSSVATNMMGVSGRLMIDALIAGQRDPKALAELAKGRLRVKRPALIEALTGRFDEHHAELAELLLGQIDSLSAQIERLDARIEQLIADLPAAQAPSVPAGAAGPDGAPRCLAAVDRLDEITGVGRHAAQVIIAEVGLSMAIFPTAGHLVSWAKLSPRTIQSGASARSGKTGKGNPYLKAVLGEAAASAARTNTFLGVRYRRLVKRVGKLKALVAIARSILVIVWHLLADPTQRYTDLGPEFFDQRVRPERRKQNHIHQLEALGYKVTLEPAAA
jgi:transposase